MNKSLFTRLAGPLAISALCVTAAQAGTLSIGHTT
ncbi:taurine ABC transporter substrate-binding protein, partial [Bacillus cereus]